MGVAGSASQRAKREHWLSRHGWNVLEGQGSSLVQGTQAFLATFLQGLLRMPAQSSFTRTQGPLGSTHVPKGIMPGKNLHPVDPTAWTPSCVQLKLCWSVAVGLPCSAARDHLSVGPLSCGLGPMWALMPFKTLCLPFPFVTHPQTGFTGQDTSQWWQFARVLPSCPISLSPHGILKTCYSPILWMGSLGHKEVRTFPRPHTKGGIQNQASSKASRAGSTLQPLHPPRILM